LKISNSKLLETEEIVSKLKESLEKDYGDYGRTQYVIEKLKKEMQLPKSDYLYIDRMINSCKTVIEEPELEKITEGILPDDLIKCYQCDLQIALEEKSVRKNNFWFHDKCFEKISIIKSQVSQVSQKSEPPSKVVKQRIKIVQRNATYPQMIFSGGLLASLVGTTYFLAEGFIASMVGIWGTILYIAAYQSNIIPKKKQKT
jgi:hypothetical protein